jgi:hypothetical protein
MLHREPLPGVPISPPKTPPHSGEELLGYEVFDEREDGRSGCGIVKPQPSKMRPVGWAAVIATALLFWPASCVPCCMACSYPTMTQRPVYDVPHPDQSTPKPE